MEGSNLRDRLQACSAAAAGAVSDAPTGRLCSERVATQVLLLLVLGPALRGLSPFVPIESQQIRYLVTVIGILTLSLLSFVLACGIARRLTPKATASSHRSITHSTAAVGRQ